MLTTLGHRSRQRLPPKVEMCGSRAGALDGWLRGMMSYPSRTLTRARAGEDEHTSRTEGEPDGRTTRRTGRSTLSRPAGRPVAALAALAALVAAALAVLLGIAPPRPGPADAPAGEFSADRAYDHVQVVAAQPHVAGSAGQRPGPRAHAERAARAGPGDRGAGHGRHRRPAQLSGGAGGGDPGPGPQRGRPVCPAPTPTGRVFLVAHYDSVQAGPGGNDDAAGTSAILEVARALTAGPRPRNDVVFVLTDAEEACLCGAAAFAAQPPAGRRRRRGAQPGGARAAPAR